MDTTLGLVMVRFHYRLKSKGKRRGHGFQNLNGASCGKRVSWQELQSHRMWVREWYPHPLSPIVFHTGYTQKETREPGIQLMWSTQVSLKGVQNRVEEDREWLWRDKRKTSNE